MVIRLRVTSQEYDCLSNHTPEQSPANHALTTAAVISQVGADAIEQSYEIVCDERQAEAVRSVAQEHCPAVVAKLDEAVKKAKVEAQHPR